MMTTERCFIRALSIMVPSLKGARVHLKSSSIPEMIIIIIIYPF